MTDEGRFTILSSIATFIFSAGGFYIWARISIRQLQKSLREQFDTCMKDIDGVAARTRDHMRDERRHYHNLTLAVMVAVQQEKETEITKLLQEQGGEK